MFPRLIDPSAKILIQGITGKEGSRMARWMRADGAHIVGGVTPGKGGQMLDGTPVYDSVDEAVRAIGTIDVSCIVVPPLRVAEAVRSAIDADIKLIYILSEHVPVHDVRAICRMSEAAGVDIIGPASVGFLQFPPLRLGYLGGERPFEFLKEGSLAVVSTSGGMTNEILSAFSRKEIGVRMAVAIGGGMIGGLGMMDAIRGCEACAAVRAIAIFAEPGQAFIHEMLAGRFKPQKPLILLLPGECLDLLPKGRPYGHTGTMLGEADENWGETKNRLRARGFNCVDSVGQLVQAVCEYV